MLIHIDSRMSINPIDMECQLNLYICESMLIHIDSWMFVVPKLHWMYTVSGKKSNSVCHQYSKTVAFFGHGVC